MNKYNILDLTEKEIHNEFDGYYVYAHIYIPTNEVYYVGKGCRRRCCSFCRRDYYDLQDDIEIEILARFDNQDEALKYEEQEIFYFKYIGQAKYNKSQFHEGKKKIGEGESEMAIDNTEVTYEIDSLDYSYCNEFDIHKDVKFENVKLHKMELGTIRNLKYRSNVDSFMSNLSKMTYEEVKSMYDFAQQNLREGDIDLRNAYHIVRKHLKKYFK